MRHGLKQKKLNRTKSHRRALLANMANALIKHEQIKTTLPKAKTLRSYVEKLITLGKKGTLAARRQALSTLKDKDAVSALFATVAPAFQDRAGGYTRIPKLGKRSSDSSEMALLEWVDYVAPVKKSAPAKGNAKVAGKGETPAEGKTKTKAKAEPADGSAD